MRHPTEASPVAEPTTPTREDPAPAPAATQHDDHGPELFGAPWVLRWPQVGRLALWLVVMIGVYVGIGELLVRSSFTDRDQSWSEAVADARTPTGDDLATWGSMLSNTFVKIALTSLIVIVMFRVWKRWLEPTVVAVALILEATAFIVITYIVQRPRPDVPHLEDSPVNSSFPSGHVAAAAAYGAIALVVCWHLRSRIAKVAVWAVPVVVTLIVAASRVYEGMHYVSDVTFGALLGIWSVAVTAHVLAGRRTADATERDHAEAPA